MKKVLSFFLAAGLLLFCSNHSFAQAHLRVTQIYNFPSMPDTAYEGQHYDSIHIVVQNIGTMPHDSDVKVFLYSTNLGIAHQDTLRWSNFHVHILPGQSVSLNNVPFNYYFRSIHYAAGDNIIVVWPVSSSSSMIVDSFYTTVHFTPSVGIMELSPTQVRVFPNPVSQYLHLNYDNENNVEQVRIYDLAGREIYHVNEAVRTINLSEFDNGLYFLEIIHKDGRRLAQKILVTNN